MAFATAISVYEDDSMLYVSNIYKIYHIFCIHFLAQLA